MNRTTSILSFVVMVWVLGCDSAPKQSATPYTNGQQDVLRFLYTSHVPLSATSSCTVAGGCDILDGLILGIQTQYPEVRVALEATPVQTTAPLVGRVEVPITGTLRLRSTSCANLDTTTHACESDTSCTFSTACTGYPIYVDVEGLVEGTHELVFRTSAGDEVDRIGLPVIRLGTLYDGGI